jgi:hypothetical protein
VQPTLTGPSQREAIKGLADPPHMGFVGGVARVLRWGEHGPLVAQQPPFLGFWAHHLPLPSSYIRWRHWEEEKENTQLGLRKRRAPWASHSPLPSLYSSLSTHGSSKSCARREYITSVCGSTAGVRIQKIYFHNFVGTETERR